MNKQTNFLMRNGIPCPQTPGESSTALVAKLLMLIAADTNVLLDLAGSVAAPIIPTPREIVRKYFR